LYVANAFGHEQTVLIIYLQSRVLFESFVEDAVTHRVGAIVRYRVLMCVKLL